jgi:hypothetical protein
MRWLYPSLVILLLAALCVSCVGRRQCQDEGGRWVIQKPGLVERSMCLWPTEDAGLYCTDISECEGWCVPPDNSEYGDEVTGTCSEFPPVECWDVVEEGVYSGFTCFR